MTEGLTLSETDGDADRQMQAKLFGAPQEMEQQTKPTQGEKLGVTVCDTAGLELGETEEDAASDVEGDGETGVPGEMEGDKVGLTTTEGEAATEAVYDGVFVTVTLLVLVAVDVRLNETTGSTEKAGAGASATATVAE